MCASFISLVSEISVMLNDYDTMIHVTYIENLLDFVINKIIQK